VQSKPHFTVKLTLSNTNIDGLCNHFHIDVAPQSPSSGEDDDDFVGGRKKPKRGVLPKHATSTMRSWLFQHIVVRQTKLWLSKETKIKTPCLDQLIMIKTILGS
jgi:hypothetical protein